MRKGFTLVELAIVLVIIGLIVGGVLVGQDLVSAARLRSVISDIEKYKTSVYTFKDKYGGYPGDLDSAKAVRYGFVARLGTEARGDGNGLIEHDTNPWKLQNIGGEGLGFWKDLSDARLIKFRPTYPFAHPYWMDTPNSHYVTAMNLFTPSVFNGDNNIGWMVYSNQGINFLLMAGTSPSPNFGLNPFANVVSPQDSYYYDSKMDDGMPLLGNVQAITSANPQRFDVAITPAAPAAGVCVTNGAGNPYNVGGGFESIISCQLRFKFF